MHDTAHEINNWPMISCGHIIFSRLLPLPPLMLITTRQVPSNKRCRSFPNNCRWPLEEVFASLLLSTFSATLFIIHNENSSLGNRHVSLTELNSTLYSADDLLSYAIAAIIETPPKTRRIPLSTSSLSVHHDSRTRSIDWHAIHRQSAVLGQSDSLLLLLFNSDCELQEKNQRELANQR